MNTFGTPYPIPLFEVAQLERTTGHNGNAPAPISFLEMSARAAAYLYYKADTIEETYEFEPLASGPGTRIDYSSAAGWDGTKAISTTVFSVINPLPEPIAYPGALYTSDLDARNAIRGYDIALYTQPVPAIDAFGAAGNPGYWMGIGTGGIDVGTSFVDGSMRYNCAQTYTADEAEFEGYVTAALSAWATRLTNWKASEEAKIPPNTALIADIERQQAAQVQLAAQTLLQRDNAVERVADLYQTLYDALPPAQKPLASHFGANLIAGERESFGNWIAAEELLEAYAVTVGSLQDRREPFRLEAYRTNNGLWFGWQRSGAFGSVGARLSTQGLAAMATNGIPALTSAQIGISLWQCPQVIVDELPQGAVDALRSVFEIKNTYSLIGSTDQLEGIVRTSIGPVTLGTSAAAANIGAFVPFMQPGRFPAVQILESGFLSGVGAGACPIDNPDCDPYIIRFGDVYDAQGQVRTPFNSDRAANAAGEKEWAFQTSIVTYSGDPGGTVDASQLATIWQPAASAIVSLNTGTTSNVSQCGVFRIEAMNGEVLCEMPLYTQTGTVGGLNIVWRVLTERL